MDGTKGGSKSAARCYLLPGPQPSGPLPLRAPATAKPAKMADGKATPGQCGVSSPKLHRVRSVWGFNMFYICFNQYQHIGL